MKIYRDTGIIECSKVRIKPLMQLNEFENLTADLEVEHTKRGGDWIEVSIGELSASFYFEMHTLKSMLYSIGLGDEHAHPSWDDWSLEGEMKRKSIHDDFLVEKLKSQPPYSYSWGTISSVYDAKGGSSMIVLRYSE